jgi:citrate lyase beta subunit
MSADNPRRCLLFVPGARPDRFAKALSADADQVCIDLEDAVPMADKASARAAVIAFLADRPQSRSELGVRINPPTTDAGRADMAALSTAKPKPDFVMIAKTESAADVSIARAQLGATPLIALLESPHAVFNARSIAAEPGMQAMMFGGYDYAVAARVIPRSQGWLWPRSMLAAAAAEAGIGAIDVPSLEVNDLDVVKRETAEVLALGFSGRAAIHPAQVAAIQNAYLPDAAEADRAQRIIAATEAANGAVVAVDGKMVDLPIELAARRTLALARHGLRT